MTTNISMLAVDLSKGSFQVCAVGSDGNDRADAEAIAEAASRPAMRFVAVKSAETQGRAVAFRTH